MNKKNIIFLFLFFFILFFSIWIIFSGKDLSHNGNSNGDIVNSFEDCTNAGYAVLESYPRRCITSDGQIFIEEDVEEENEKEDLIVVDYPISGDIIESPITITGQARGYWFFEGDFPVRIYDDNGNELGLAIAVAEGDWMTEDFVPFSAKLEFENPETSEGVIVLEKDNPSGMSELDDSLEVKVLFRSEKQKVALYYYNSSLDKDESGNVLCSEQGLVSVERYIDDQDSTLKEITKTIDLLLLGNLTDEEKESGISTEFYDSNITLNGVTLSESGSLKMYIKDPENITIGGACRVGILKNQLIKTAEQFDEVQTVTILPEELFQP